MSFNTAKKFFPAILFVLILSIHINIDDNGQYSRKSWACTKAHNVVVYADHNKASKKVNTLDKSTVVEIEKHKLGWTKVVNKNQKGWIKNYNLNSGLQNCNTNTRSQLIASVDK